MTADVHHLPETWSDERAHVIDRDCWCTPAVDDTAKPLPRVYHYRPGTSRRTAKDYYADPTTRRDTP